MKKILGIIVLSLITIAGFGQLRAPTGLYVGKLTTNGKVKVMDSVIVDNKTTPTLFKVYSGATQLSPDIPTSGQISLSTIMPMNTDSIPRFVFGAGTGQSGDSILFAQNQDAFGTMPNYRDSCYVINFKNLYLSTGDSLKFNAYIGNSNTRVARDSCFTSPQALGVNQRYFTPNGGTLVLPDECVWIKMSGTQLTAKRPYRWEISINCKQQNRTY